MQMKDFKNKQELLKRLRLENGEKIHCFEYTFYRSLGIRNEMKHTLVFEESKDINEFRKEPIRKKSNKDKVYSDWYLSAMRYSTRINIYKDDGFISKKILNTKEEEGIEITEFEITANKPTPIFFREVAVGMTESEFSFYDNRGAIMMPKI